MRLTCEEESSLTARDANGVRFAGSPDGEVAARDNEDCPPGARPTAPARSQAAATCGATAG